MKLRWKKPYVETPYTTTRIKERFLLFPRSIDGIIRWWEVAKWCETLGCGGLTEPPFWVAKEWVD